MRMDKFGGLTAAVTIAIMAFRTQQSDRVTMTRQERQSHELRIPGFWRYISIPAGTYLDNPPNRR